MKTALKKGEDVNSKDEAKKTGLMWAMINQHHSIVSLILEQPTVDLNCVDNNGRTALHKAAISGNVRGLRLLLADPRRVDLNCTDSNGRTAMYWAARFDNAQVLKLLMADPRLTTANHMDKHGNTPVMAAMENDRLNALRELVSHLSTDLDTRNERGESLDDMAR